MPATPGPASPCALVVDDAEEVVTLVAGALAADGFDVRVARDGAEALDAAREMSPDLVVLDLGLPTMDGMEVCRCLREFSDAYVIMLTARGDEGEKIVGLSAGADDYLTKPFSLRELVARSQAMLRRPRGGAGERVISLGPIRLDPPARTVRVDGAEVALTRIEFEILHGLLECPGVVMRRHDLIDRVWGGDWLGDEHVVDVHVSNLRRKIATAGSPRVIMTVRGVGYRADPPAA